MLRNDGGEGHGLIGGYDREAELDSFQYLVGALASVIPRLGPDGRTAFMGDTRLSKQLAFIRGWNGVPALIRKIKVLAADKVRAYCQMISGNNARAEFNFDAPNPFQRLAGRALPAPLVWENSWGPLCYLPDRTTDSFTGRLEELGELKEWFDDADSRACLIYGDGGLGKTTLALEFVHRVLDEDTSVAWHPKLVLFYTAKRWQWGLDGLRPISAGQPHLLELIAHLHMLIFGAFPSRDYYHFDLVQATSFLQSKIKADLGFARSEILVVIDNAETLIENEAERSLLGKELKEVARRIGKVLLTSRRRELIEATPIALNLLSNNEALDFLKDRGRKLNLKIVARSTDAELLDSIRQLERRPIVLDAFANALADPSVKKLAQATARVASMLNRDLGEFLFADAWARLTHNVRRLLLLMTRVGDAHDAQSLRICANVIGVPLQLAEQSFEESGGIASLVSIQGSLQVTFSKNFIEFAREKTIKQADGSISPSAAEVASASAQYSGFIQSAQKFTGDRIVQAFRTPQARAAHRARQEGKIEESKRLYEAAILTDSTNGWLFDRYAYFLFHDIHDNDAALHQAKRAAELLPGEGEVWYTRGLIEARLGQIRPCELSLAKAEELGIELHRTAVQRCWAYLKAKPVQFALANREIARVRAHITSNPKLSRISIELDRLTVRYDTLQSRRR